MVNKTNSHWWTVVVGGDIVHFQTVKAPLEQLIWVIDYVLVITACRYKHQ